MQEVMWETSWVESSSPPCGHTAIRVQTTEPFVVSLGGSEFAQPTLAWVSALGAKANVWWAGETPFSLIPHTLTPLSGCLSGFTPLPQSLVFLAVGNITAVRFSLFFLFGLCEGAGTWRALWFRALATVWLNGFAHLPTNQNWGFSRIWYNDTYCNITIIVNISTLWHPRLNISRSKTS